MKENKQESSNQQNTQILYVTELEQTVLGAIINDKNAYFEVSNILTSSSFYEHVHQLIYKAITDLAIKQKTINMQTVKEQLNKLGVLEEIGGLHYINQLCNKANFIKNIKNQAHIIAQKYMSRQLLDLARDIYSKITDETQPDTENLISEIRGKLSNISLLNVEQDCSQINLVIDETYKLIQKAAAHPNGISGLESGFTKLDKMTSGWQNGDLINIGARPGMGKTAFILSMLKNMVINLGTPVVLFSLETTKTQLMKRLMANVCEISNEKLKSGQLANYEWAQLDYKLNDLLDVRFHIDDSSPMKIDTLCNKAHYYVREKGVKLIVIDYIQLLYTDIKHVEPRYSDISYFTRRLKSLAIELNIPIIITSQLNRSPESREGIQGKRPKLADLRDSGTLCDDPDIVIFLHRPEYYGVFQDDQGNDMRGMAEVIIAKHRTGSLGDVLLRFKREYSRFSNPENPEDDMSGSFLGGSTPNSPISGNTVPPTPFWGSDNPFQKGDDPLPF